MARHVNFVKLHLLRLEERNPCSDTLGAILGNLGIASIFDTMSNDIETPPPSVAFGG